jgi:hypothetical protein
MSLKSLLSASLAALLLLAAVPASADPPGRVGRIGYVEGAVSFHTADQQQWVPAPLNYPVVAGESFWTEPAARLELEVGAAEIRLDSATALEVTALNDRSTQLSLAQGALNLHLVALPPGGAQVTTPQGLVDLLAPGTYDIDVGASAPGGPPDQLRVTTLEGRATVPGPRSPIEVVSGEAATVAGNPPSVTLSEGNATPFDDWALGRDEREMANPTLTYVSPETTGYEDLAPYGEWTVTPAYGAIWYPTTVVAGWAPYRYGHWAWIPPWGWTWIDDAPWGFAPFHYGRWVEIEGRWGWCPGERVRRPIYAPALVAFIGGARFGVAVATGPALPAVGWIPLAPHEIYRPTYRTSVTYIRNINIATVNRTEINHITNVTVAQSTTATHYHNLRAATVVPAAAFTRAAPVQKAAVSVPHAALAEVRTAPRLQHLQPSPAARAGIAVPAAAAVVPHPGTAARIARPAAVAALPPASATRLPHAPGPPPRQANRHAPAVVHPTAPIHPAMPAANAHHPPPVAGTTRPPAVARPAPPRPPVVAQHAPPRLVHPVQRTQLMPTPHGWVRSAPQTHPAAPHPPAAHPAPPHPAPAHPAPQDRGDRQGG